MADKRTDHNSRAGLPYAQLLACFFLSGATALVYEVLWVRMLALHLGNTVYAVGVVVTAFMAGLSAGSWYAGRWADRSENLLLGYARIEFGIAGLALVSPLALGIAPRLFNYATEPTMHGMVLAMLKFGFSAMVLLPPTMLMGATLPILGKYLIRTDSQVEPRMGMLYALNTLGGALGTVLVGFVLLRTIGLAHTLWAAAAVNVLIGAYALRLHKRLRHAPMPAKARVERRAAPDDHMPLNHRFTLLVLFVSGATAMAYQAAWNRMLLGVLGSTTYAFSIILTGVLVGIGLGSLTVSYLSNRFRLGHAQFAGVQSLLGLFALVTVPLFFLMPAFMLFGLQHFNGQFGKMLPFQFALVMLFIILPTLMSGMVLPIAVGIYRATQERLGRAVGNLYAANTVGAIVGMIAASFVVMPMAGSDFTIRAAALLNLCMGVLGYFLMGRRKTAMAAALLLALPLMPLSIPPQLLDSGVAIYGLMPGYVTKNDRVRHQYFEEGMSATVSVTQDPVGNTSLRVNGKTDASLGADMSTQLALGYIPVLLHPDPRDVFVLGYGSGVTVRAVRDFPVVRHIDCVEIEPRIVEAGRYFSRVNRNVADHPSVSLYVDDARSFLSSTDRTYDLIISQPSNLWLSGTGNLFTLDFYRMAVKHLREGGLFAQWVQAYSVHPDDLRMVFNTFTQVFPEATLWVSGNGDLILIGSRHSQLPFDARAVGARLATGPAAEMRAYLHITDPLDVFAYFITGTGGVRHMGRGAPVNTDDLPLLEFNAPRYIYDAGVLESNKQMLSENMTIPPIAGMDVDPRQYVYRKLLNISHIGKGGIITVHPEQTQNPQTAEDYLVLAIMALFENSAPKAHAMLKKALEADPAHGEANFTMGMLLKDTRPKEAIAHMLRAIESSPYDYNYHFQTGTLLYSQKRTGEALGHLLTAENLPHRELERPSLYYNIGLSLFDQKDYFGALTYFTRTTEVTPFNYLPHIALAKTYLATGKSEKACEHIVTILELVPSGYREDYRGVYRQNCPGEPPL